MATIRNAPRPPRSRTVFGSFVSSGVRETLYTCPDNCTANIVAVFAEEVAGSDVLATITIYKTAEAVRYTIANEVSLTNTSALGNTYEETNIIIEEGDLVEVKPAGSAPQVDAFITVEEVFSELK